jgi:Na+-driven multidrug efflux pump
LFAVLCKNSGVAIGSGWQALVVYVNLACYYVIGLTVGCVLGFKTSLGVAVSLNNSLTDFSVIFVQS